MAGFFELRNELSHSIRAENIEHLTKYHRLYQGFFLLLKVHVAYIILKFSSVEMERDTFSLVFRS